VRDKGAAQVERLDELLADEGGEGCSRDVFDCVGQDLEGHVGVVGRVEGLAEGPHFQNVAE